MTSSFKNRLGFAPEEGIKSPCVVSTTADITLSGEQTIDGVAVVAGDRVLVRSQTNTTENGIYDADTGAWARSTDWNAADDVINGILVGDANSSIIYQASFSGSYEPDITTVLFNASSINIPVYFGIAAGTVDVITVALDTTLAGYYDGLEINVRAIGSNTVPNVTISPDGLDAKPIKRTGNEALVEGDIPGADYEMKLRYNSSNGVFELLNPLVVGSQLQQITTVEKLETLSLTAGRTIYTQGYYVAGDPGAATRFVKTAAQAATDGDIANGGNILLVNGNIAVLQYAGALKVAQCGAKGDGDGVGGGTDDILALKAAASISRNLELEDGLIYKITDRLDLIDTDYIKLSSNGRATIDATTVTDWAAIFICGQDYPDTDLSEFYNRAIRTGGQALGSDAGAGGNIISIPAALGLAKGDIIRVSSSVLFNPSRSIYWKGELAEVHSVSGDNVTLTTAIVDSYTAATTIIFKLVAPKVEVSNITLLRDSDDTGLSIWETRNTVLNNVHVEGARIACIAMAYIYGGQVNGCSTTDAWYSGTGQSYGLSVSSSQGLDVSGNNFNGGRHAITLGGYEPCRFNHIHDNEISVIRNQGSGAFDLHGNCQYNTVVNNSINGGANFSGSDVIFKNNHIKQHASTASGGNSGIVAYFEKDSSYTLIEDNEVISYGDGSSTSGLGGYAFIGIQFEYNNVTVDRIKLKGNKCSGQIGFAHGGIWVYPLSASNTGNTIKRLELIDNDIVVESGSGAASHTIFFSDNTHGASNLITIEECVIQGGRYEGNVGRIVQLSVDDASGFLDIVDVDFIMNGTGMYTPNGENFSDIRFNRNRVKKDSPGSGTLEFWGHDTVEVIDNTFENMTGTNFLDVRNATKLTERGSRLIATTGGIIAGGTYVNAFESFGGDPTTEARTTAAPVAGTWAKGDIVWNEAPVAGGTMGWVCTTAGTPGTWKSWGVITA